LLAGRKKEGRPGWLSFGLVALVVIDLAVLNTPWVVVPVNGDDIFEDAAASRYVAAQEGTFRVETDANTMYRALDDGAVYGLEKASGDDSLVLDDYYRYRELLVPQQSPGVQLGLFYSGGLTSELLDVMNDRYFLTRTEMAPELAEGKFEQLAYTGGVFVYRNRFARPRAWMSEAVAAADVEEVYEEMAETGGEGIRETALVVYPPAAGREIPVETGPVEVISRSPHHLELRVGPSCRGLLVTADIFYPGWEVYVDGEKEEMLRTNLIFRGVLLDGGQRTVEFRFHPSSFYAGVAVSLLTACFLVLYFGSLLLAHRRKDRHTASKPSDRSPFGGEAGVGSRGKNRGVKRPPEGMAMKLSVIVPVHNEESTVEEVIRLVRSVDLGGMEKELVIVDDASTDGTAGCLEAYRPEKDIVVLRHDVNRGKGAAIRTGLAHVTGEIVVIQDADLEYDPGDYPRLIRPVIDGEADVVYGSRFLGSVENMEFPNLVANKLLAWAATVLFAKRITDEATCYKLFKTDVLRSFDLECERFEFCPEVTAKTLRRGYRLLEVPISYSARTVEAGKKIRAADGLEAIWTLVRFRFKR
jgi:dolichol-phosphate mannosyltransferase